MKNPLLKRLRRELRAEFGKYMVIFLFMAATIGFVSGFLVADNSMITAYKESFEVYNIEDGHFITEMQMDDIMLEKLQENDMIIHENFYKEETEKGFTYRIFKNRNDINLISILEGRLANKENEIAIDRLFAENNKIHIGDEIHFRDKSYQVCGLVAFSDYSCLFRKNTDMMFDAQNFTVAAVTDEAFEEISNTHLNYCYAWENTDAFLSDKEKKEQSDKLMNLLAVSAMLKDFVPEPENQAIHFSGNDMGSDKNMMIVLLYLVIVIMAFVFAITTSNTIEQESAVIGTLRALGYTRKEVVVHYLSMPLLVTLAGAVTGNVLGYTVFKNVVAGMYYGSYSLPSYTTLWSGYAFVLTTVIPCMIMFIINLIILNKKLLISPLKFLRRDLKKNKKRKVVVLPDFSFLSRFRLRVILQNLHGYGVLFIGIFFANVILLFGLMMTPLLKHYKVEVLDHMICNYQYVLKTPVETEVEDTEKYAVTTLETNFEDVKIQNEITIFGIVEDSDYVPFLKDMGKKDAVVVSSGILEKYGLEMGDSLKLKSKYGEEPYTFTIRDSCEYPASMAVFMNLEQYCEIFGKEDGFYSGYFSDQELTDVDEKYIASAITQSDLTILADQLFDSMGSMFPMISAFSILLYMLLVYLLSKIILEKNASSISMVKILGYQDAEIARLYLYSTAAVVIVSVLASIPLAYLVIKLVYVQIISSFSGWLSYYVEPVIYMKMFVLGIAAYMVVGILQFRKIKRIPMEEALKIAE